MLLADSTVLPGSSDLHPGLFIFFSISVSLCEYAKKARRRGGTHRRLGETEGIKDIGRPWQGDVE